MLNQIQNTISKVQFLRKGLLVVAVLGMLVSGFVIGDGVRVEAEVTEGYYLMFCKTDGLQSGECKDTGSFLTPVTPNYPDKIFGGCEPTNASVNDNLADWFCKSSKDNSDLVKKAYKISDASKCVDSKCEDGGKSFEGCTKKENIRFCANIVGGATTEDSATVSKQADGALRVVLNYNEKNINRSCVVEVVENTKVNGSYIPKGIVACAKGEIKTAGEIIKAEEKEEIANTSGITYVSRQGCQAISPQVKGNIGLNRDNVTLNCYKETVTFSGGEKSDIWYSKPTFVIMDPQNRTVIIDLESMVELCGDPVFNDGAKFCKLTKEAFFKEVDKKVASSDGVDFVRGEAGTNSTGVAGVGSGKTVGGAVGDIAGGLFTIIYQIVAAIIMVLLFIIRYLQMTVLLLFISVMTVLLNLSPNTGFLTTLAVPLWSIFAQIASLGAVGILIFLGSATMIGIDGFEYEKTIAKGAQVAIYVFVSNFTYFGLAFAISLLDGFTKLIVFVFGGGSVFKLFEALIASVSSISKIQNRQGGYALIPDIGNGISATFNVFGKSAGDVTTTLVAEIIVVIGLGLIIWVFGRIFFMLLTRVAILLLLLITSPIWVLGILVKDSLPSGLQGQVSKAVDLVGGTIVFNFAFITTLVLVTIITQKINGGISDFQKTIADAFVPATNSGLAFIDGVSANAQTSGVLSNDAFLGFGAGGFGETISVCAVLGINLAIIYFAFDAIANLIDTNIQSVGKAVGGAVGKNLKNFREAKSFKEGIGMMGQDAFKYGKMAATGGNTLIDDAAGAGMKLGAGTGRGLIQTARLGKSLTTEDGRKEYRDRFVNATKSSKILNTLGKLNITGSPFGKGYLGMDEENKYNAAKAKYGDKPLSIEEEKREQERQEKNEKVALQNAERFDSTAQKNKDDKLNGVTTDAQSLSEKANYEGALTAMNAAEAALDLEKEKLASFTDQLEKFQTANGYTKDTDPAMLSPQQGAILSNLRNEKLQSEGKMFVKQNSLDITKAGYSRADKVIKGTNVDGDSYVDLAVNERVKETTAKAAVETAKTRLTTAKEMENSRVTLVDKSKTDFEKGAISGILNDASTVSKRINKVATGGKTKYEYESKFEKDAAEKGDKVLEAQLKANENAGNLNDKFDALIELLGKNK
jgi:hypothetical protein